MFDAVFAAFFPASGVAPIMFGNEFLVRSLRGALRLTGRCHGERFPTPPAPPLILGKKAAPFVFEDVAHGQRQIRLSVKDPCNERDSSTRHQLADEDHATAPFLCAFSPNIKAEIHFFEVAMERDWQADHARIEKQKADDAEEGLSIVEIELGLSRNKRLKNFWIDGEIEHGEITPVRRQKWFLHQGTANSKSPLRAY
jgi:hypothetical protein